MAKINSIFEQTNVETVELFIIDTLLKEGNVVIPDFGHLELKSLGERRTVIFKPADSIDLFKQIVPADSVQEQNITKSLFSVISVPLKEEKIVNLHKIGIFRPLKRNNGEIQISFLLSTHLRNLLNNKESAVDKEVKEEKEKVDEIKKTPIALERKDEEQKTETITEKVSVAGGNGKSQAAETVKKSETVPKSKPKSKSSDQYRISKIGETLVPQDDVPAKSKTKSMWGTILLIVAVFAFIVIIVYNLTKKGDESEELAAKNESISLPDLAKKHYGHPAFWIYIYDANSDKLSTPINIPKQVQATLIIPDLKTEYDVDITDSLEIQRANILTDIVLKKKKNNNK